MFSCFSGAQGTQEVEHSPGNGEPCSPGLASAQLSWSLELEVMPLTTPQVVGEVWSTITTPKMLTLRVAVM